MPQLKKLCTVQVLPKPPFSRYSEIIFFKSYEKMVGRKKICTSNEEMICKKIAYFEELLKLTFSEYKLDKLWPKSIELKGDNVEI